MKWAYSIRRKISAALLLAAIFVLLFVKSMIDNSHVNTLANSFSSVYEDRLVVESYIYKMSEHLFRKKIMIDSSKTQSALVAIKPRIDHYNQSILEIIAAYQKTKLTTDEDLYFDNLKGNIEQLISLENSYFDEVGRGGRPDAIKVQIDKQFNQASEFLDQLSRIQLSEGKLLNETSQKIVAGSSLLTQFEIGILIAVGLMVFVLIFESTAIFSKTARNQSLN